MTRVWGRKKIIWVSFCTQQVSCDWQSSSQNYSSRNNPNSRVSFAAEAVLMTCLTAACWSLESALTCRAVNREMRGSIEIKPSLCWQPRVRGSKGFVEKEGREAQVWRIQLQIRIVKKMTASDQWAQKAAKGNWRAWLKTQMKRKIRQLKWTKRKRWKMKVWQHGLWRESTAPCLAGYHTLRQAHSSVCSCSLLTKGLCLPYKKDNFHNIQSPADIHFKIRGSSLMKKQWQDTECLSMPHWYPVIRNLDILAWLQSFCTNKHASSQSVCLSCPYTVLFYINPSFHTPNTNVTQAKGKGLEVSDLYVHASKCWQHQQASFDGDSNW